MTDKEYVIKGIREKKLKKMWSYVNRSRDMVIEGYVHSMTGERILVVWKRYEDSCVVKDNLDLEQWCDEWTGYAEEVKRIQGDKEKKELKYWEKQYNEVGMLEGSVEGRFAVQALHTVKYMMRDIRVK